MKDEQGCNCGSEEEHKDLIRRVDESYKKDVARAKMRHDRNSFALRAAIISASNGFTNVQY